ncbi:hypothetical protein CC86DRAFT_288492, partial [Ophiobolus disseminans]
VRWLEIYARNMLDRSELMSFRILLLRDFMTGLASDSAKSHTPTELLLQIINVEMQEHYMRGGFGLLKELFRLNTSSIESQRLGAIFVDLLTCLGLDVEACINMELGKLPEGCMLDAKRRVVFEPLEHHGCRLRWEWVSDPCDPGFLLMSEHIGLGPDCEWWADTEWPFPEAPDDLYLFEVLKQRKIGNPPRFNRRMANKARKERARTGQKRTKSRMPGSWNW